MKLPTMRDVAAAAGVSVSTVSRVLGGRGDISRDTRERVSAAADALGYLRDPHGSGRPVTSESRLIELVLGSFDDAWTDAITTGVRRAVFTAGLDLALTLERDEPDDDWPVRVATRRPLGVIIGIIRPTLSQLDTLRGLHIPVTLLDPRSDPHGTLPSIGATDEFGGRQAGLHLAASDARRFVILNGSPQYRFGRAREQGFRDAISEAAPRSSVTTVLSDWVRAEVTTDLLVALRGTGGPVGVFACNDEMASSVYRAAAILGMVIPRDVRVVGFNDEPRALTFDPPLSSVHQQLDEMAARAVEMTRGARNHNHLTGMHERYELETTLVVRQSSQPS